MNHVCASYQSQFSAYLDGAVSGQQMQQIGRHLERCGPCKQEFDALRATQQSLAMLGTARPPADLGMKLRIAISHERAAMRSNWKDAFSLKWENTFRPLLVQVSAGFASSVVLIGGIALLLGMFAAPEPVMANDEPLGVITNPHYLYSAVNPRPIVSANDAPVVVEAYINEEGRVYDYNMISGPTDTAVQNQVVDQLVMSVFQPASVFGSPVRGRVILTFSGISVRG